MIHLEDVTMDIFQEFIALSVNETQTKYVASSLISLAQAYVQNSSQTARVEVKAIYHNDDLIGYTEVKYVLKDNSAYYDLHRFMIDKAYQGYGYGNKAFQVVMDYIKTMPLGNATKVILEYMPENVAASHIYHSYGFIDTDQMNKFGEIKAEFMLSDEK